MSEGPKFADGIYYNLPSEKAPDWVKGSISIQPEKFSQWLLEQTPNDKGYVRLAVKIAKGTGKPYVAVDDYQPKQKAEKPKDDWENSFGDVEDDIPW